MGEDDLREKLHDFLKGKRYLIVLDDVWRLDTWEVIQHAFPDPGNGSRVMLTTRNLQVANQADKLTYVHRIRLLNEQESWQLFSLKAFPSYENIDDNNRQELESVGKSLVRRCNGLPLALVVLGSHLSKNFHLDTWSEMDRCLDWEVASKWDNVKNMIARSYDDKPHHYLKSCFLYMASFPEDFGIQADNLTRLWIAEGFVPHRTNRTLEKTARDFLEDLAQRSMVHIHSRDITQGRISYVQMHDILREWAIQQARKEGFLKVCRNQGDVSDGMLAYRWSFLDFFDDRICISAPNMRSMLGFHLPCVTLGTLRFLRTLYMFNSNLERVSEVIGRLIHLRYIGLIHCRNVVLPSSIGQLLNLQSIDLRGTEVPCVPKSLWAIPTLRHVDIKRVEAISPSSIIVQEQSELQTLCLRGGGDGSHVTTYSKGWFRLRRALMHMPQLTTLELNMARVFPLDVLTSLSKHRNLDRLALSVSELETAFPDSSLLPQNIRYLCLRFSFPWNTWHTDVLPTLGRLQSLVTLLLSGDYQQDDAEVQNMEAGCTKPRSCPAPPVGSGNCGPWSL